MKKLLIASLLLLTSACADMPADTEVVTGKESKQSGCENIKGVVDQENGGKIYYTKSHRLYSFIKLDPKMGDKNLCSMSAAKSAGFRKEAPEYFADSAHTMIGCLESESEGGSCHTYIDGIFQSLKIYDKTCGSPSKSDLSAAYIRHAKNTKNGEDVSKYSGATGAFLKRYGC